MGWVRYVDRLAQPWASLLRVLERARAALFCVWLEGVLGMRRTLVLPRRLADSVGTSEVSVVGRTV